MATMTDANIPMYALKVTYYFMTDGNVTSDKSKAKQFTTLADLFKFTKKHDITTCAIDFQENVIALEYFIAEHDELTTSTKNVLLFDTMELVDDYYEKTKHKLITPVPFLLNPQF